MRTPLAGTSGRGAPGFRLRVSYPAAAGSETPSPGRPTTLRWAGPWIVIASFLAGFLGFFAWVFLVPIAPAVSPDSGGPLVVLDRNGEVLRRIPSPDGRPGREAWVSLSGIPAAAVMAVVASEDQRFFDHHGIDFAGMGRAAWLDLREERLRYGGSTLTMQLCRMIDSQGRPRTLWNKIREVALALRIERHLSKSDILEAYLNRAYFGNGAYGIEAAARTYFGKPAASLSAAEAVLLAVLPRSPSVYDPTRHLTEALKRRDHVLGLMQRQGLITGRDVVRIRSEGLFVSFHPPEFRAPHFVEWVLDGLPDEVKRQGGKVHTTLDLRFQEALEHRLSDHVAGMTGQGLHQAGLVVLDTKSGEVLAMAGSAGFPGPKGQINITTWRRSPGSALKPFLYAIAIEEGASPASIAYDILDVPSDYRPANYSKPERGPVRFREALAGSYNLAAVHVLERIGVPRLMTRLKIAGVGDVPGTPRDYGLPLALGATRVRLLDLAAGYGFLVRGGKVASPRGVAEVELCSGETWRPEPLPEQQAFSPQTSFIVMHMLSDPEARRPMFGEELPLDDLPFDAAFKTGTAKGFADAMAVGVTAEITAAAWAGNFDGSPMHGVVAMQAAAPLVREALLYAAQGRRLTLPARPEGVVQAQVCPVSGLIATEACPHRKIEYFLEGHVPTKTCTWHEREGGVVVVRYPAEIRSWAERSQHAGGRAL